MQPKSFKCSYRGKETIVPSALHRNEAAALTWQQLGAPDQFCIDVQELTGCRPSFVVAPAELPRVSTRMPVPDDGCLCKPGMYTLISDLPRLIIQSDDVSVDLNQHHVTDIYDSRRSQPRHRVSIRNGSAECVLLNAHHHEDITISGLTISGECARLRLAGARICITSCDINKASNPDTALFINNYRKVSHDIRISNCRFSGEGRASLVKINGINNIEIINCTFSEGFDHHLRFHSYHAVRNNVWVQDCSFTGAGNGIGVGFGDFEEYGYDNVTFYRCALNVGGPDKVNFDRDRNGAHARNVRVIECTGDWT